MIQFQHAALRGIGTDIASVARIRASLARFGDRFLRRAFSEEEVRLCASRLNSSQGTRESTAATSTNAPYEAVLSDVDKSSPFFAARWAAKEALTKAVASHRFLFPEVSVLPASYRLQPTLFSLGSCGSNAGEVTARPSEAAAEVVNRALNQQPGFEVKGASGKQPCFYFTGAASCYFSRHKLHPLLSISHEDEHAVAFVVLLSQATSTPPADSDAPNKG